MASSSSSRRRSQAGVDRSREWKRCCQAAFGWTPDHVDLDNDSDGQQQQQRRRRNDNVTLVNLVPKQNHEAQSHQEATDWWHTALRDVEANLAKMTAWLAEKRWTYAQPSTSDDEASLIQSTISSYTVTTANELENLRRGYTNYIKEQQQMAQKKNPNTATATTTQQQQQQHDMAVIQILSQRLKEEVAQPFAQLQKKRQRAAVQLWQNPYSCRFVAATTTDGTDHPMDTLMNDHNPHDKRFCPQQARMPRKIEQDFLVSYNTTNDMEMDDDGPPAPPTNTFLAQQRNKRAPSPPMAVSKKKANTQSSPVRPPQKPKQPPNKPQHTFNNHPNDNNNYLNSMVTDPDELHQEAMVLQALQETHDLDAVSSMEETMVQITALLSQFSDLVATQAEDVLQIHEAVSSAKQHMDKGQDELVDAKERAQNSRHYMASAISAMAVMLLFFHWVRP